jgi:hypothetical protein
MILFHLLSMIDIFTINTRISVIVVKVINKTKDIGPHFCLQTLSSRTDYQEFTVRLLLKLKLVLFKFLPHTR